MSWYEVGKNAGWNEGYGAGRAAALKELNNKEEMDKTKKACLEELLQQDPKVRDI